jgi:hypothetical protein
MIIRTRPASATGTLQMYLNFFSVYPPLMELSLEATSHGVHGPVFFTSAHWWVLHTS